MCKVKTDFQNSGKLEFWSNVDEKRCIGKLWATAFPGTYYHQNFTKTLIFPELLKSVITFHFSHFTGASLLYYNKQTLTECLGTLKQWKVPYHFHVHQKKKVFHTNRMSIQNIEKHSEITCFFNILNTHSICMINFLSSRFCMCTTKSSPVTLCCWEQRVHSDPNRCIFHNNCLLPTSHCRNGTPKHCCILMYK